MILAGRQKVRYMWCLMNGHEVYSLNSIMSNISPALTSNLVVVGFFRCYEGLWWFSDLCFGGICICCFKYAYSSFTKACLY